MRAIIRDGGRKTKDEGSHPRRDTKGHEGLRRMKDQGRRTNRSYHVDNDSPVSFMRVFEIGSDAAKVLNEDFFFFFSIIIAQVRYGVWIYLQLLHLGKIEPTRESID